MHEYRFFDGCEHEVLPDQGELLEDAERHKRLVEKLTYLTVIRPDITFFLSAPKTTYFAWRQ